MNAERLFLIADVPGYTPHISRLISMMHYARDTTLEDVQGLNTAQLDHKLHGFENSIGALLKHIAAVEAVHQVITFQRHIEQEEAERSGWVAGMKLGQRTDEIRRQPLEHYLTDLEAVRAVTLEEFGKRNDDWLLLESTWWDGRPVNNHWYWFHVFEDEINHRGQIRLIRKNLPPELG